MKFFVAVALFSFQIVFPMELVQLRQRSLSPNDETIGKRLLMSQLPHVNLALLSLNQIRTWVEARPVECQDSVKKRMSPNMLLIHDVALLVDDVKKYIIFLMFDGRKENKGAIDELCEKPIAEALQLYHEIKNGLGNSDKPMGPLYTMPQTKRDFILRTLNPWYYSYPVITLATEEKINDMDEEMRQYFDGITIKTLPYGIEDDCKMCVGVTCGMPSLVGATAIGGGAVFGATCTKYGGQCICMAPMLSVIFRASCCIGMGMGSLFGIGLCYKVLTRSQKKTL